MSNSQKKALKIIKNMVPSSFGVKEVLYRIDGEKINFIFFVDKARASSLISYINALTDIINDEYNIKMSASVYIKRKNSEVKRLKVEGDHKGVNLKTSLACA